MVFEPGFVVFLTVKEACEVHHKFGTHRTPLNRKIKANENKCPQIFAR